MDTRIQLLITKAQQHMRVCRDPVHNLSHAERVAQFAASLAKDTGLPERQKDAVVLAAWWHDVSRTITKNPSFVLMPFVDDTISAFMLWYATIRAGLFGSVAGMATRIIFCKSLGTGAIFTRLLMRQPNRILIDVIKDADALDTFDHARMSKIMPLVEMSRRYYWGYKTMVRWFLSTKQLQMRTQAGRAYMIRLLKTFLEWVHQTAIYAWHVAQFGQAWCKTIFRRGEKLLRKIERQYFLHATPA